MVQKQIDKGLQDAMLESQMEMEREKQRELCVVRGQRHYYLNNTANAHRRGFSAVLAGNSRYQPRSQFEQSKIKFRTNL